MKKLLFVVLVALMVVPGGGIYAKRKGKRGQGQEQETKNDLDKTEEKYNRKFEKLGKKKRGRAKKR